MIQRLARYTLVAAVLGLSALTLARFEPAVDTPPLASTESAVITTPQATQDTAEAAGTAGPDAEHRGRAPGVRLQSEPHQGPLSRETVALLSEHHFVKREVDDALSAQVYDKYIEALDPQRLYFLASDMREFQHWREALDDALRAGDLTIAFEIFNRYEQRLRERLEFSLALVEAGIDRLDFERNETFEIDREDAPWATSTAALDDLWRRRLKGTVLTMRMNDRDDEEIQELLTKRYANRLDRIGQTRAEDAFQIYMNAVTTSFDPHTQYFSPRTSENFNINMRLSLEGIGAVLRTEDEYTKVVRLVPAGPADKTGELNPEDSITAVGQGAEGTLVDVVGWRLDDVVDLIRGAKGTTVRLEVRPANGGEPKTIRIVRNTVKLEEQSAQANVIQIERGGRVHNIGVIDVPTFYIDFQAYQRGDADYKSTTRDVSRLIAELRESHDIDGLIIDLRNNGGGSLQEANELTGLFIPYGPTVQTVNARKRRQIHSDRDHRTTWDGPMVVMINRLSASASEIFAGAMQDYQRAVLVGEQTFGKGTVQQMVQLSHGAQLKLTQSKFYRVSGATTQHQGVMPDIEFPSLLDHDLIGESALDDALPPDNIRPAIFARAGTVARFVGQLQQGHDQRTEANPEFHYLESLRALNAKQNALEVLPLNETARRAQLDAFEAERLALENARRVALGEPPVASLEALDEAGTVAAHDPENPLDAADNASTDEVVVDELAGVEADEDDDDPLLDEAGEIMLDLIRLQSTEQLANTRQLSAR